MGRITEWNKEKKVNLSTYCKNDNELWVEESEERKDNLLTGCANYDETWVVECIYKVEKRKKIVQWKEKIQCKIKNFDNLKTN